MTGLSLILSDLGYGYLHKSMDRSKLAGQYGFLVKKIELFGHHRNPKENGLGYIGAILVSPGVVP